MSRADVIGNRGRDGPRSVHRTARGLGDGPDARFRVGVPVWGVCSLDAWAPRNAMRWWWPMRDGVRCTGRATATGQRVEGPAVAAPADVAVGEGERVVGRGAVLYPEVFPGAVEADPDPLWLAREALRRRGAGEALDTEPLYLRRPDVHGS